MAMLPCSLFRLKIIYLCPVGIVLNSTQNLTNTNTSFSNVVHVSYLLLLKLTTMEEDFKDNDSAELLGNRDGTIFIIDATPPMFATNKDNETPYFLQCLKQFENILKLKLSWNRQDYMGLILLGTEESNNDSEIKNFKVILKLEQPSKRNLKTIIKILNGKWKDYRETASSKAYPLHNVLWHAAQEFSIKIVMPVKRVVLFTCQDVPPLTDINEKHRIIKKASNYHSIGIRLSVVGLGDNWNNELFYKDLEILSEKIKVRDYKRTTMQDLMEQVKFPSRIMAKLPWRIGTNVTLDVCVYNLTTKINYLIKVPISSESNAKLARNTILREKDESDEEELDFEDEPPLPILETDIQKCQEFGGRKIFFTPAEERNLSAVQDKGIDLICVKKKSFLPTYHLEAPYFVAYNKSYRKDNKLLFGALLNKCESRQLMLICTLAIRNRSTINPYAMIPYVNNGGFYLYKIPYKENVRDLSGVLSEYMYDTNDNDKKPPIDPEGVELFEKIIEKTSSEYDPVKFLNPKLEAQVKMVETVALDLEHRDPPPDCTLPQIDFFKEKIEDLINKCKALFTQDDITDVPVKKRTKKNTEPMILDDECVRRLIRLEELETCTVLQLKEILKNIGENASGKKGVLLDRIKKHYD